MKKQKSADDDDDKMGGRNSPGSDDSSSGNMSSNDDEEDCAAHTCLRPTGKRMLSREFLKLIKLSSINSGKEVDWVQCDGGCEKWFHLHCVGLSKTALKDDEDYYCAICSGTSPEPRPTRTRSDLSQSEDKKDFKKSHPRNAHQTKESIKSEEDEKPSKILNGGGDESSQASIISDTMTPLKKDEEMDVSEFGKNEGNDSNVN
jgi:hypothetical protein